MTHFTSCKGTPRQVTAFVQNQQDIIRCAANEDMLQSILGTFLRLDHLSQADVAINALHQAFPKGPDPRMSTRILSSLAKNHTLDHTLLALSWHNTNKYELNHYHYTTVIDACAKACDWSKALHLFSVVMQGTIELATVTFNATISACEKGC
eukprot:TRINITY_DN74109_c0_g1_i1.p1 TRINITY_DN74109_c0_g1~~TRINITY_DN74109_c0_g1_i1.p1  ORF type:complete len:152 (+),score=18.45 TRINITY_DN74109_c0_g1_i1:204-659(+)